MRMCDGLHHVASPWKRQAAFLIRFLGITQRQHQALIVATSQTFVPIRGAQPELFRLVAIADGLKVLGLEGQLQSGSGSQRRKSCPWSVNTKRTTILSRCRKRRCTVATTVFCKLGTDKAALHSSRENDATARARSSALTWYSCRPSCTMALNGSFVVLIRPPSPKESPCTVRSCRRARTHAHRRPYRWR